MNFLVPFFGYALRPGRILYKFYWYIFFNCLQTYYIIILSFKILFFNRQTLVYFKFGHSSDKALKLAGGNAFYNSGLLP